MSGMNSQHNRAVWFDIPVVDLERACKFYEALLGLPVHRETMGKFAFGVLHHSEGNGGCLIPGTPITEGGVLVYLNVDGRIRSAVAEVEKHGGKVTAPIQSIGPHGFRAIILDSEGNRMALHSETDA